MGIKDNIRANCEANGSPDIKKYMGTSDPASSDSQYIDTPGLANFIPELALGIESFIASLAVLGTDKATGSLKIGDLLIQWGWGSIQGNDSRGLTTTMNYPIAYTQAPLVLAVNLGTKLGAPLAITEFTAETAGVYVINCRARSISMGSFVVDMTVDVDYGVVSTAYWEGFAWLSLGKWNA